MDGCGEQEFYLPPLDDILPHAQIDVVVRNAVRMPLGHLQVLLIRAGECAGVGFTDKRGRVSFTCVVLPLIFCHTHMAYIKDKNNLLLAILTYHILIYL
jgi:hypothetical protein